MLAIVGEDTIRVKEYERAYVQMRSAVPETLEQKEEFLNLLVDYKLKVKEAKAQGLEKNPEVQAELEQYRNQLAVSFLIEKLVVDPGIQTLYSRRLEEINPSHILIKFHRDQSNGIDSVSTYHEAMNILATVKASKEPFDSLVMRYSEDGAKTKTHGSLGWFIAGISLPELDDMVYSMKLGEISPVLLKSQYGYHIIKVTGRQKARLRLRASQILYRLDINNPLDTAAGFARLSLILDSLQQGKASFEDLARRNSQDPASGAAGGDLGWVERGTNLEPRFEEALFNLPTGQTSPIIRTQFGMHIIRVTDETGPRPIDEQRPELRAIFMKERFNNDYKSTMKALREKHGFRISPDVFKRIISKTDSSMTTSTPNWSAGLTEKELDAYLFRIDSRSYTVREAVAEISVNPLLQMRKFTHSSLDSVSMIIADNIIQLAEAEDMERRYPEFLQLLKEYRESTIISRLETDEVYQKTTVAESDIRKYWEAHQTEFRWPDRVLFSEIWVYSEVQAKKLVDSLHSGADFAALAALYTRRTGMFDKGGSWGWQPVDKNELTRIADQMSVGVISGVIKEGMGFSILKVEGKDPARQKTFDEARTEAEAKAREEAVAAGLRQYVESLRKKHSVNLFPDHLSETFKDRR